eukprot:symbB.v1.2.010528.t1/scaffold641.1/size177546/2
MRQALSSRSDVQASLKANHWRFPATSYVDVLRWLEWNPKFRCRVNSVPTWVLKQLPPFQSAAEQAKASSSLRLSAATRRLLAELPPLAPVATVVPAPREVVKEELNLSGLGGSLLPFQVEAVRYAGSVGACHPFNYQKFDLQGDCLHLYERATGLPEEEWEPRISSLHRFAVQVQNCSTVQQCGLGMLFLNTGAMLTPGYDATAGGDYWRLLYWTQMQRRVSALQRRRLLHWLRVVRVSPGGGRSNPAEVHPKAEEVTIGIHADQKSAKGPWRGQLNAWQAFAEMHGHRFLLDLERHFTGTVFARYLGLFWASSTDSDDGFWSQYSFLRPSGDVSAVAHRRPQGNQVPDGSFLDATLDDPKLLEKLRIFNQPPGFWDSLEALAASVSKSPWTVWIDFDLTISPCCFDSFAFTNLIGRTKDGGLPHVVIRDSPHEDYHHHCANAGFVIVRNSSIGRLFVEMAKEKRPWPSIPYGYQSALAESLLELLGVEAETFGDTPERYRSECLHHLTLGRPWVSCWRVLSCIAAPRTIAGIVVQATCLSIPGPA